jgi:uncharacterized membrane protein (UPF0127 family)
VPDPPTSSVSAEPFAGLARRTIHVDSQALDVVFAGDKGRGLMGVDDLGSLDGMLFEYPEPSRSRFWMRDVRFALDVAFFDADGRLLAQVAMPLCLDAPSSSGTCPTYSSPAPFSWALETEAGAFRFAEGAVLTP